MNTKRVWTVTAALALALVKGIVGADLVSANVSFVHGGQRYQAAYFEFYASNERKPESTSAILVFVPQDDLAGMENPTLSLGPGDRESVVSWKDIEVSVSHPSTVLLDREAGGFLLLDVRSEARPFVDRHSLEVYLMHVLSRRDRRAVRKGAG